MQNKKTMFFAFIVMMFGVVVLAGCDGIEGGAKSALDWALFDKPMLDVLKDKFWPTHVGWWILAFVSMYLPIRDGETQKYFFITGIFLLLAASFGIVWTWLSGLTVLFGLGAIVFGGAILGTISVVVGKIVGISLFGKKVLQMASGHAGQVAETVKPKEVIKAEEPFGAKQALLLLYGIIGGLIVVAILFGGTPYPPNVEHPNFLHHWDALLRGIGVLFAIVSFFVFLRDLGRAYWFCPRCKRTVWDWGQNKEQCTYEGCRYFNPLVIWKCACNLYNYGTELKCATCDAVRHNGKKWVRLLEAELEDEAEEPDHEPPDAEDPEPDDNPPPQDGGGAGDFW